MPMDEITRLQRIVDQHSERIALLLARIDMLICDIEVLKLQLDAIRRVS